MKFSDVLDWAKAAFRQKHLLIKEYSQMLYVYSMC